MCVYIATERFVIDGYREFTGGVCCIFCEPFFGLFNCTDWSGATTPPWTWRLPNSSRKDTKIMHFQGLSATRPQGQQWLRFTGKCWDKKKKKLNTNNWKQVKKSELETISQLLATWGVLQWVARRRLACNPKQNSDWLNHIKTKLALLGLVFVAYLVRDERLIRHCVYRTFNGAHHLVKR